MNFIESVLNGNESKDNIDNWVENWHKNKSIEKALHEYLGMTHGEYCLWVLNDSNLDKIIGWHKKGIKFL